MDKEKLEKANKLNEQLETLDSIIYRLRNKGLSKPDNEFAEELRKQFLDSQILVTTITINFDNSKSVDINLSDFQDEAESIIDFIQRFLEKKRDWARNKFAKL